MILARNPSIKLHHRVQSMYYIIIYTMRSYLKKKLFYVLRHVVFWTNVYRWYTDVVSLSADMPYIHMQIIINVLVVFFWEPWRIIMRTLSGIYELPYIYIYYIILILLHIYIYIYGLNVLIFFTVYGEMLLI